MNRAPILYMVLLLVAAVYMLPALVEAGPITYAACQVSVCESVCVCGRNIRQLASMCVYGILANSHTYIITHKHTHTGQAGCATGCLVAGGVIAPAFIYCVLCSMSDWMRSHLPTPNSIGVLINTSNTLPIYRSASGARERRVIGRSVRVGRTPCRCA
jgi:hypothetical protein